VQFVRIHIRIMDS